MPPARNASISAYLIYLFQILVPYFFSAKKYENPAMIINHSAEIFPSIYQNNSEKFKNSSPSICTSE